MDRIKLLGKEKSKRMLLIILVLIALGVISYQLLENRRNRSIQGNDERQEEAISPQSKEESSNSGSEEKLNKTIEKDAEIIDSSSSKNQLNKEKEYSSKENELYNEAYKLFFSHEYSKAISKANDLVSEFPGNAMGYNIRGISKAYNGDYDGGMNDIDKSLNINSNYGYARFNKALVYELYGNMDKALEWYNRALEIEEYVWSYYGIASIYGRRGDVKNTMIYLNKAIKLDSGVKEVAKNEEDFNPVKNSKEFQNAVYN